MTSPQFTEPLARFSDPLVICYIAIENSHGDMGFPIAWWIFPQLCNKLPAGIPSFSYGFPMGFPTKATFSLDVPKVFP